MPDIELDAEVLQAASHILDMIPALAALTGVESVEVHAQVFGEPLVFGYGQSGDPAILVKQQLNWFGPNTRGS